MSESTDTQLTGSLSDYFVLESHLGSTRSADTYKAIDRSQNVGVCVWLLRHPLAPNSQAVQRFLNRMQAFQDLRMPQCPILGYGVDNSGMAFSVFPPLDGYPLTSGTKERTDAERRFMGCVKLIEKFHSFGLVCGDLCHSSFWLDRSGDHWFTGVMGSFDSEAVATAMLPPMETLQYVAPEQRSGGGVEPATDVFALGVLGYYLITGHFPFSDTQSLLSGLSDVDQVPPLSTYDVPIPPWAEEVLFTCMSTAPEARYRDATELVQAIQSARQRIHTAAELPVKVRKDPIVTKSTSHGSLLKVTNMPKPAAKASENDALVPFMGSTPLSRVMKLRLLIAVVSVFVISLAVGWKLMRKRDATLGDTSSDLSLHVEAASDNKTLKQAIGVLQEGEVSLADKIKSLEELVKSDDPVALDIIVRSALDAKSSEFRAASEKAIVERARRLGMIRSAEQIRQWLRTVPAGEPPPSYTPLLKSLNTTNADARDAELREAYKTNPKVAIRLAAALALDAKEIEEYHTLMSQLVGDSLSLQDAKTHSTLGLILGHPELALVFGDDVVQRRSELTDSDIIWLLKLLADRNDFNVRAFASLAVERGILSPLRQSYLELVRDREDVPSDATNALVRASAGALKIEDVGSFGRWVDTITESILLAICADVSDDTVLTEAFDILAGKSLSMQPSTALVDWVRKTNWNNRKDYARVIGMLAHSDKVTEPELRQAFTIFDKHVKDNKLISILVDSKNPLVTEILIEKHAETLSLGTLLNLLDHPEPGTRILAVNALKPYHDVGALKIIVDHYAREKNPQVLEAYKEHWVIQNRLNK